MAKAEKPPSKMEQLRALRERSATAASCSATTKLGPRILPLPPVKPEGGISSNDPTVQARIERGEARRASTDRGGTCAPPGECPYCDRRRAQTRKRTAATRQRQKEPTP